MHYAALAGVVFCLVAGALGLATSTVAAALFPDLPPAQMLGLLCAALLVLCGVGLWLMTGRFERSRLDNTADQMLFGALAVAIIAVLGTAVGTGARMAYGKLDGLIANAIGA